MHKQSFIAWYEGLEDCWHFKEHDGRPIDSPMVVVVKADELPEALRNLTEFKASFVAEVRATEPDWKRFIKWPAC